MSRNLENLSKSEHFDKKGAAAAMSGGLMGLLFGPSQRSSGRAAGGAGGAGGPREKSAEERHNDNLDKENEFKRQQRGKNADLRRAGKMRKDTLTDVNESPLDISSYEADMNGKIKFSTRAKPAEEKTAAKTTARKSKQLEKVEPKNNTKTASTGSSTSTPNARPKKGYSPGAKF
jgi:hypothetical protein